MTKADAQQTRGRASCRLSTEDTLIVAHALLAAARDSAKALRTLNADERAQLQARAARRRDNARWYAAYAQEVA